MKNYWSIYKTDQLLRLYEKGKTDKIVRNLPTYKSYEYIKIDNYPLLFFLISEKNTEVIEALMNVKYKEKILHQRDEKLGISPSTFALVHGEYDILELLKKHGSNVFVPGENGNTAMHFGAFFGKTDVIEYCIKSGFDINAKNNDGETALHVATAKEFKDIVSQLIENKANLLIENNLHYFPLHEAVETENIDIVKLLLPTIEEVRKLQKEFDVVHLAAKLPSSDILRLLLKDKMSYVNMPDNEKRQARPIHYAVIGKSRENIDTLASLGAKMNVQDANGNTPMHLAVLDKDLDLIRTLHLNGANAKIKNNDGYTALDYCFSDLDKTLLKYFRSLSEYRKDFKE